MTPELRQAITILQLSSIDLIDHIKELAIENPLIDIDIPFNRRHDIKPTIEKKSNEFVIDNFKKEQSLQDFLISQVGYLEVKKSVYDILIHIIYSLDEKGFLPQSSEDLARETTAPLSLIREAISIVQELEPYGVGARNLQECLLIQLRQLKHRHPIAEFIIEYEFQLFIKKQWTQLAKKLSITLKEIQEVADTIQMLTYRPAVNFANEETKYITPDLVLEIIEGQTIITINDTILPPIQLNEYYKHLLKTKDTAVSIYVKEKYEQLQWLKKSIEQRKQTLLRVAEAIFQRQNDFFTSETQKLHPLTLKEIANDLDIHESTVSRATNQKYIQTPKGLYELKYFFNSGLNTQEGSITSSHSVKEMISTLIQNEDKKKPYSDQQIAENLNQSGVKVSRRTVAKYREEMNIPSSQSRRRY